MAPGETHVPRLKGNGLSREMFLDAFFGEAGNAMVLGGNTPLLIDDTESVWMVAAGVVDVFFVQVDAGTPCGPRHYCTTLDPGQFFFVPIVPPGLGLVAVSSGEARLLQAGLAAFQALAGDPEHRPALACRLDLWIKGLVEGAVSEEVQFTDLELEPAMEVAVESDLSLRTHGPVVWVEVPADRGVYMDRRILGAHSCPVWVPVSGRSWLWIQAGAPFTLRTRSTEALMDLPDFWGWLREFYTVFFSCTRQRVLVLNAEERQRLVRLGENTRHTQQAALQRMQQVLTGCTNIPTRGEGPDALLAACAMVGQTLGIVVKAPLEPARPDSPPSTQVARVARASDIRVREVFLQDCWWRRDHGPLLAFRGDGHRPVALLPASPSRYLLHDPENRQSIEVNASLAASLDPKAYAFYRSLPNHGAAARELLAFGLLGTRRDMLTLSLVGILGALLGLLTPMLTGLVFDTVIPQAERPLLLQVAIGLTAIAVGSLSFEITKTIALLRINNKANRALQCAVWDRLLKLPVDFFRTFTAGDLAVRAMGFSEISNMVKGPAVVSVLSALFTVCNLILMFYYSTKLALIGLVLIAAAALFVCLVCRSLFGPMRRIYTLKGELTGTVLQLMAGIGKLRSAGAEVRAFGRWAQGFSKQMHTQYDARLYSVAQSVFTAVYPGFCTLVLFLSVGMLLKSDQPLTIGTFLAFNSAFGAFLAAVLAMSTALVSFVGILFIHESATPILQAQPEADEARLFPGRLNGRIEVNQVSFRYDRESPFILENVTLQAHPGELVALVGPSGSGKSTLFRLLLGFETPELGCIFYDRQELSRLDVQSVRRQIGTVLQNGSILPGTIFQNIVGGAPLSLDDAWQAARLAGIDQDIREMPMQMHTHIMEGGGGFSGGQKQRLMIARAVAGNPRILFFDEATSALDNQTQDLVSKSLENLRATRLVIAHRLSTIIHADRIYVLEKGRIVQEGHYETLMAQDGPFRDLATRQVV